MTTITLAMARQAVDDVIARAGEDYHYKSHRDSCEYYRETDEDGNVVLGCLIGEAWREMGFEEITGEFPAYELPLHVEEWFEHDALKFFQAAQTAQDGSQVMNHLGHVEMDQPIPYASGATWGQARDYANRMLDRDDWW